MERLNQDELLGGLENLVAPARARQSMYYGSENEQIHKQIKEMIWDYAEHQELTANYIDIVIDLYEQLEAKNKICDEMRKGISEISQIVKMLKKRQED